jgi:hypothetical protein
MQMLIVPGWQTPGRRDGSKEPAGLPAHDHQIMSPI